MGRMPDTLARHKLRIPDKKPLGVDHSKYPVLQRSTCSNPKMFSFHLMKNMRSSWDPCGFSVDFCFSSWIPRIKNRIPLPALQLPRWRWEPSRGCDQRAVPRPWTWCRGAMSPAVALQVWFDLTFLEKNGEEWRNMSRKCLLSCWTWGKLILYVTLMFCWGVSTQGVTGEDGIFQQWFECLQIVDVVIFKSGYKEYYHDVTKKVHVYINIYTYT